MEYLTIIKEKANEYAIHYYQFFKRDIKNNRMNFKTHLLDSCKFDEEFYGELLADIWDDISKDLTIYLLSTNESLEELKEQVKEEFLLHFKKEYLQFIEEDLEEIKEELQLADRDYIYYEKREYKKEEDIIGVIDEKERLLLMEEIKERKTTYEKEKTLYESAKKEIQNSFFVH